MNGLNVSPSKAFDKTLHIATTGDKGPEMGDKDEKMPDEKHDDLSSGCAEGGPRVV